MCKSCVTYLLTGVDGFEMGNREKQGSHLWVWSRYWEQLGLKKMSENVGSRCSLATCGCLPTQDTCTCGDKPWCSGHLDSDTGHLPVQVSSWASLVTRHLPQLSERVRTCRVANWYQYPDHTAGIAWNAICQRIGQRKIKAQLKS